jgi:hypothetical protein
MDESSEIQEKPLNTAIIVVWMEVVKVGKAR